MHLKTLALILLAGPAHAAGISYKLPSTLGNLAPIYMPAASVIPMSLPTVNGVIASPSLTPSLKVSVMPIPAPVSLPVLPAAAIGQARLPGVPSPLPLPERAVVRSAPAIDAEFVLNWTLLDDDGEAAAPALVPNDPGPRPLSPAGALNELRDASKDREPIRTPGRLFDGKRETHRELELPFNKYF